MTTSPTLAVRLAPLRAEQRPDVIGLLARAYVTNPLHVAAFGPGALARNETFFREGLAVMRGAKIVALEGGRVVGVAHWVRSPECQLSLAAKLRLMPTMLGGFGPPCAMRVGRWLSAWSLHDPARAHLHLGPIAVAPARQAQGIGSALMQRYCDEADRRRLGGYLETDREENVGFYRRFGFELLREVAVLGVPNYLMWREARPA